MTRILITGSRDWHDRQVMLDALCKAGADFPADLVTVVHGGASGADMMAAGIATNLGWLPEPHPAGWAIYGKAAGFIRNQHMVDLGADVCLAFFRPCRKLICRKANPHDSHGATDCAELAERAGIPVRPYHDP